VEVVYNIHRWNSDMARPELRKLWRKRSVRYFAHDPRSGLFAPSKFAAYLLMSAAAGKLAEGFSQTLTGMGVRAYTEIDQQHPLFDGNRAWEHLHRQLGMAVGPLDALGAGAVDRFWRWAERFADVVGIDSKGPVVLTAPEWGY
jgi:hypothetical protein